MTTPSSAIATSDTTGLSDALGAHRGQCRTASSVLLTAVAMAEKVHEFVLSRVVTTLFCASTLLALMSWGA
ncbi:MAG: hypothetical protein REI09_11270 [Candidatus Dactylopiibacterium sp.]|nr:hypothetical protein [Candidatus Dactylopiibacterium sp.]